jgi:hypothetical protein
MPNNISDLDHQIEDLVNTGRIDPLLPAQLSPRAPAMNAADIAKYILTGGFLAGYRTYISAALVIASGLAAYAMGDSDLVHTITTVATGLGLGGLRAAK